ncbi:MAG: HEPN domain-containing protein, partial [Promethearchaeota archaeon]
KEALERAKRWYQGAVRAFEDRRWDDVIYSYEMAVEHALKAILILYGIEYPKKHDISIIYLSLKNKNLPESFSKNIDTHAKILNLLVKKRGSAAYGYVEGININEFMKDAKDLKQDVEVILNQCEKLLNEFNKINKSEK